MLKKITIIGIIFVSILGTLGHFFYEWSGQSYFVGLFFPVNESTWEHMKLLFFPTPIYLMILNAKYKKKLPIRVTPALIIGLLWGLLFIPSLFYTYGGILGFYIDFINIAIFYVCVIISFLTFYDTVCSKEALEGKRILYGAVFLIAILFFIFTFSPPSLGIFTVP